MADALGRLGASVTITGESSQFKANIDSDIAALKAMGQVIDTTNRTAVNAWREEVTAQREVMQQLGATQAQVQSLNAAVAGTEKTIQSVENQWARSTTQIGRGLFMVAGQGEIMGRGLITSIGGAAAMFGGPWITAIAVAGLALTRFWEKGDHDAKVFQERLQQVMSELAKMGPAGQEQGAQGLTAQLLANQDAIERLRHPLGADPVQDAIQTIVNMQKISDLNKENEAIEKDIVRLRKDEAPAKQAALTEEAFHTTLLREQASVLSDITKLEQAREKGLIGTSTALQAQLARDQGALSRTRADIARLFPASGLTSEAGQRFGQEEAGFQETVGQRSSDQRGSEAERREAAAMKGLERALDHVSDSLAKSLKTPAETFLSSIMAQLGVGQQDESGRLGNGLEDPTVVAARQGIASGTAFRKSQDKGVMAHLAPGEQFTVPPGALDSWTRLHEAMDRVGKAQMKLIEDNKKSTDGFTQAAKLYDSVTASVIGNLVQTHKIGAKALAQAAVSPIVSFLEGKAIEMAARALADWSNPGAVALDLAAAAALTAGAAEVSALVGGGGGGGGGGASGGGGGGQQHAPLAQQGIGSLGGQRAGQSAMSLEVILVQQSPSGKTLQRLRQQLQRLDDRQVPVRMNLN